MKYSLVTTKWPEFLNGQEDFEAINFFHLMLILLSHLNLGSVRKQIGKIIGLFALPPRNRVLRCETENLHKQRVWKSSLPISVLPVCLSIILMQPFKYKQLPNITKSGLPMRWCTAKRVIIHTK